MNISNRLDKIINKLATGVVSTLKPSSSANNINKAANVQVMIGRKVAVINDLINTIKDLEGEMAGSNERSDIMAIKNRILILRSNIVTHKKALKELQNIYSSLMGKTVEVTINPEPWHTRTNVQ